MAGEPPPTPKLEETKTEGIVKITIDPIGITITPTPIQVKIEVSDSLLDLLATIKRIVPAVQIVSPRKEAKE